VVGEGKQAGRGTEYISERFFDDFLRGHHEVDQFYRSSTQQRTKQRTQCRATQPIESDIVEYLLCLPEDTFIILVHRLVSGWLKIQLSCRPVVIG
jgi:hypothetical protein